MILTIAALFMLVFGIAAYQENNGNFTINLGINDRRRGMALGADRSFSYPTSKLYADRIEFADNISYNSIPWETDPEAGVIGVDEIDGSHNGQSYVAYTFYLKNEGLQTINYRVSLSIEARAKGAERATWIMVIEDSTHVEAGNNERISTLYALGQTNSRGEYVDENGNILPQGEKPLLEVSEDPYGVQPQETFASKDLVFSKVRNLFAHKQVHKYTVVIWIEGSDPQSRIDITGGMIRLKMNFAVLG